MHTKAKGLKSESPNLVAEEELSSQEIQKPRVNIASVTSSTVLIKLEICQYLVQFFFHLVNKRTVL